MKVFKTLTAVLLVAFAFSALGRTAPGNSVPGDKSVTDSKAIRPVQENRVHRAGLFWLNVTNNGYFGNPDGLKDPCTGRPAVSGELPGGSETDFLFVGSLLFGGYLNSGIDSISQGHIFQGPLVTTSYEGWTGEGGTDNMARECWPISFTEDPNGTTLGHMTETSNVEGRISCLFEDVYDPFATAEEQFNVMYTDKFVQKTPYTGMDDYDGREHIPLGVEIRQKSYAWSYDYAQKFVIIDYTLYNKNTESKDIYDFFMGLYLDCDIGMTYGKWTYNHADDLGGFIQKWDKYIDPATGERTTVDLNLAWAADNDGRNYTGQNYYTAMGEPGAGAPLDGATSIATVRVLRNPNPNLRYAFNMYVAQSDDEAIDWGPRWQTGLHADWQYDLTKEQKGYDDTNQDGLHVSSNDGAGQLYGGRTEGRPIGDKGRYMVLSNDEFDYEQYKLRDLYLGRLEDPEYMQGTPYAQADKWQIYTTPENIGQPGTGEITDGTIPNLNDLANGADVKYLLSFGPLGTETRINIATDTDNNGVFENIPNKKVWKFAYGDSLKLTMAFIVNENFHTSLEQDPNYDDDAVVNLEDGLDPELYNKGWYDALYNVVWAERVYDIPMHDTYVKKFGKEMGDGWYGEDIGKDGIFGDIEDDTFCWWNEKEYSGPDGDGSEGNFDLDTLTTSFTDVYGHTATSEDDILPYGREIASQDGKYGITGSSVNGDRDGYGYMVKYDKADGAVPVGTWVRYGFNTGKVDVGDGVPDFTGPPPPPSPKLKISYLNNDVVVEWQSHEFFKKDDGYDAYTGPELFIDPFTRKVDFEGYQVQVSPDDNSQNYVEVFSVDKMNMIYEDVSKLGEYYDAPVNVDTVAAHPADYPPIIAKEGKIWKLINFGDNRDIRLNHSKEGVYTYTAEAATQTITVAAGVQETVNYYKYKFVLHNKLYAKQNYVAVTSSDFGDPKTGTPALKSNPAINGSSVIPTKISGTKDVYVVPNPYRGDADYEAMGWENIDQADLWEEQDRKIVFMNVPLQSVLKIYTLAGDLVKTIGHNGNSRVTERYQYGEYGISWDLINDNNQAVSSGIYLFSVQDVADDGYEQIGKFVIIK
ncbi:MAG TPA: hypothetical protein PLK90_11160 [Clostridiales bacterium]|nr:hypothetical protein [Clostridiales bacterium]